MIYSNFLLESRKRVHDARDKDGNIITDAGVDGIRWTSAQLAEAIKQGLMEFTRDVLSLDYRHYFNSAYLFKLAPGTIAKDTGLFTFASGDADTYGDILRIETPLGTVRYTYKDPDIFFSEEYQNNTLDNISYVFTRVTDENNEIVTYALPISTTDIQARAFATVNLESLFVLTNTKELPFHNIDDLMLDYAARNCNLIEHDMQQFELYNKVIDKKLQIIKARDVKEMGK
jgi:hypothetical protein